MRTIIKNDLDKLLAQAGVILSILLFAYLIFMIRRPIYLIVCVLTFCSCVIWLLVRNNVTIDVSKLNKKELDNELKKLSVLPHLY